MANAVFPNSKEQQQRNPPSGPCPHDESHTFDERPHGVQGWYAAVGQHESRSGIGADCSGAHDHPQQRRHIVRIYFKKEDTIGQQHYENRVEPNSYTPQHVDEHTNGRTETFCRRRDERA